MTWEDDGMAAHGRFARLGKQARFSPLIISVVVVVMSSVGGGGASGVARADSPASASCPAVLLIGTRGTGESLSTDNGLGRPDEAFRQALAALLPAGTLSFAANPYPAAPQSGDPTTLLQLVGAATGVSAPLMNEWSTSVAAGESWLVSEVNGVAAACGSATKMLLAGYSQGAQITGDVFQGGSLTVSAHARVVGVVMFGDPHFNWMDADAYGNFDPQRHGILGERTPFAAPGTPPDGRVLNFCHARDPICQGTFGNTLGTLLPDYDPAQHANYDTVGDAPGLPTYPQRAAQHFAGLLG
jgi:hypothetical protein